MIHVYSTRNPLDASALVHTEHAHRCGATLADVLPPWASTSNDVLVKLNGRELERFEWRMPLPKTARVDVIERPGFIFVLAGLKGLALVGATLANLAAIFAVNLAVSLLLGAGRKPKKPGEQDSPTYTFTGIRSEPQAQGAAVPVLYGEHLTAGVTINQFTRVSFVGTELYVLQLISEGPIHSIGGIESDGGPFTSEAGNLPVGLLINGQPAEDFDSVECYVRLGSTTQTAIPGFADAQQILDVGFDLEESSTPGPGNVELVPQTGGYDPVADAADIALWDTLESYTMDVEADEFGVLIEFTSGLYSTSSGGIGPQTAEFQIRYRALDGGGSPTGNYVVLPPEPTVSRASTSPFTVEFRHPFFAADTYVATGAGERLVLDGVNDYVSIAGVVGFPSLPVTLQQFSACGWWRFTGSLPGPGTTVDYILAEQFTSNTGWRFLLRIRRLGSGDNYTVFFRIVLGNGTTTFVDEATLFSGAAAVVLPALQAWNFLGYGYDNSFGGAPQALARRHQNGVNGSGPIAFEPLLATSATLYVGDNPSASEEPFPGYVDGFKVFSRQLSDADFSQQYNGGLGFNGNGNEPDLVLAWMFDSSSGGDTPDSSPNANDGTLSGATISTGQAGLISITPIGTPTRGKYRIEVQRLDAEADGLNQNGATWSQVRLTTFELFSYPGRALLAVKIKADGQLSGGRPEILVPAKGVKPWQWDRVSTIAPTGTSSWTANPAWIALDVLINETYAGGDYYDVLDIDLPAIAELADYADELVEDGRESRGGGNTVTLTYSAPTLTIEIDDVTDGIPAHWVVGGYVIVRDATDTSYNLANGLALEVTSLDYDAGTEVLTIEATWPTGVTAPTAGPTADATADVIGAEVRFRYDGVFDRRDGDLWDAVVQVLQTARSVPVQRGSKVSIFTDRPRDPVGIVSMSSIVSGSFKLGWVSQHDRPNSIACEILDRDDGYRRAIVELEHPTVTDPTTFNGWRRRATSLEGVTRKSQALRHAQYQLNVHHSNRRTIEYEAPLSGLQYAVGDVIPFAADLPGWAPSGYLRTGCTDTELILDRPITVTGTFSMTIVGPEGDRVDFTDPGPSGSYDAGDTITLTNPTTANVSAGNVWALTSEVPLQTFQVVGASVDPTTLRTRFELLTYNEDVYDDGFSDFLNAPSTLPVPGSALLLASTTAPPAVQNLSVSTEDSETADGSILTMVVLTWEPGSDAGQQVDRHEVWLASRDVLTAGRGGGWMKWAEVGGNQTRAEIPLRGLSASVPWVWTVRTVGPGGIRSRLTAHPRAHWAAPARTAPRRSTGTTADRPASDQFDGDLYYDTTLDLWCVWDEARSAWLTVEKLNAQFAASTSISSAFIPFNGETPALRFAYDVRILGWEIYAHVNSTCDIELRDGSTAFDTLSLSSSRTASESGLNYTLTAGNAIAVRVQTGTAGTASAAIVHYCKVI